MSILILEEEDEGEEEKEETKSLNIGSGELNLIRIEGDYNIEIPEVVHTILSFMEIREILSFARVSTTFRRVAVSDLLWKGIVDNQKEYFCENSGLPEMAFFYDLNSRGENIYNRVIERYRKSYDRSKFVERTIRRERMEITVSNSISGFKLSLIMMIVGCISVIFPAFGILIQGVVGFVKYNFVEEMEPMMIFHCGSFFDILCACCCTCCGFQSFCCLCQYFGTCCYCCSCFCFCCLCTPIFLFLNLLYSIFCHCIAAPSFSLIHNYFWLGRFFVYENRDADMIVLSSPSVIIFILLGQMIHYFCSLYHVLKEL